jgi:hypothetical protein
MAFLNRPYLSIILEFKEKLLTFLTLLKVIGLRSISFFLFFFFLIFNICHALRRFFFGLCLISIFSHFLSSPATRHGGALGERRYISYSFTTSALDGGEWSASRPGRTLPPGKGPPVPIVQEAGWSPEPVWTQRIEEKSFAPAGDRTPIARSSSP